MICNKCGEELPEDSFYPDRTRNRIQHICKECRKKYQQKYRQEIKYIVKKDRVDEYHERYVKQVCKVFKITREELFNTKRVRHLAYAKKYLCQLLRKSQLGYSQIGRMLRLDHTTVIKHCKDEELINSYIDNNLTVKKIKRINYKTGEVTYA